MDTIFIHINHDPIAWTSPKLSRGKWYSLHSKYKETFQWSMRWQYRDMPIKGYVHVDFTFSFPMPKSASKKKRALMAQGKIYPTKSDCTNLQKFAEDCLKKIVIDDDRNVVQISSKKLYAPEGSVTIGITPLCD